MAVYGGESINKQIHSLSNGIQIVVGTPGRLIDLMERRVLNLGCVKMVVFDEADRMLTWALLKTSNLSCQKHHVTGKPVFFQQQLTTVMRVCNKYMKNPQKILVSKDEIALTQMKQYFTVVNQHGNSTALCNIIRK